MNQAVLRLVKTTPQPGALRTPRATRQPLGDILVKAGALDPGDLVTALALQQRQNLRLGDILLAHDMIDEVQLMSALSRQYFALPVDLEANPPDPRLIDEMGVNLCLSRGAVPVQRLGGATIVATCRPDEFADLHADLPDSFGDPVMALASERDLHQAILDTRNSKLAAAAETRVAEDESCRFWYNAGPRHAIIAALGLLAVALCLHPVATWAALTIWAVVTLMAATALKLAAAVAVWRGPPAPDRSNVQPISDSLPVVSIMVPLFHEQDIAQRLVARLGRLTYPKELLDICLVTEEDDTTTRTMLETAQLPHWMRIITVPDGPLKTKPRALNFALDFCRGSIIGVYDAEDAPAPDQIHKVVQRFRESGPEVACLQGVLDFYNTSTNWFSRCFTIEYATWFRMVLPGIAKLGLVVPLGGTTLFFRRDPLEELGGWDAHNVTEDADLGVRLARHGYRTALIDTVTEEEANCRVWPWVKQRSRWLKGYAMTWSVHMRNPVRLLRELGLRKFIGFQILFFGTLSQFLLVPVLWSLWLIMLGLPHPLTGMLSAPLILGMSAIFMTSEAISIVVGIRGTQLAEKRFLIPWVPSLHLYYPLAAIATYKAVFEMVARPFYWDKTAHGASAETDAAPIGHAL